MVGSEGTRSSAKLLPLTPAQRGMWFAESLAHGYSVNIAHYLDFTHEVG